MEQKKYTIISDPGVDDMIALLLLWKLSSNIKHTIISTFGNVPEEYTSKNAKEFIAFIASHWSFVSGAKNPVKPLEHEWPTYFHGVDGVWEVHPNVIVESIVNQEEFPDNSNIISLGTMTSVEKLLKEKTLKDVTVMGGAFQVQGNETPYAETNIAFDPDAAAHFFENCKDMNVKVIPLDVTKKVFWTKEKIIQIPEDEEYKKWAKKLLLTWFENYGDKKQANFDLHDPLAVYSIFYPNDLEWKTSGVKVVTEGKKRGQTVLKSENPECQVALNIQNSSQISNNIFEILFN